MNVRTILHSPSRAAAPDSATESPSPQRRSFPAKAILGLLLAVVMVGAFATASAAENTGTARSGALHVTKECSDYHGQAGEFCTITSSNINAIDADTKVIYASAAGATGIDSNLVLDGPDDNDAYGHVTLSFLTLNGVVTFSGGTGRFSGFHASVAVTYHGDDPNHPWHWDGTYSFTPPGHDG
jgi:hypothetical protein